MLCLSSCALCCWALLGLNPIPWLFSDFVILRRGLVVRCMQFGNIRGTRGWVVQQGLALCSKLTIWSGGDTLVLTWGIFIIFLNRELSTPYNTIKPFRNENLHPNSDCIYLSVIRTCLLFLTGATGCVSCPAGSYAFPISGILPPRWNRGRNSRLVLLICAYTTLYKVAVYCENSLWVRYVDQIVTRICISASRNLWRQLQISLTHVLSPLSVKLGTFFSRAPIIDRVISDLSSRFCRIWELFCCKKCTDDIRNTYMHTHPHIHTCI